MLPYGDANLKADVLGTALYGNVNDTETALKYRQYSYYPMMAKNQPFVFTCWLSFLDAEEQWKSNPNEMGQIVWEQTSWTNMTYELDKKHNR